MPFLFLQIFRRTFAIGLAAKQRRSLSCHQLVDGAARRRPRQFAVRCTHPCFSARRPRAISACLLRRAVFFSRKHQRRDFGGLYSIVPLRALDEVLDEVHRNVEL